MPFRSACVLALPAVVLVLGSRPTQACGPGFPHELFVDRSGTLADLPDGTFMVEVTHLVARPADAFGVVEGGCGERRCEPADARKGGARETALYQAGAKLFEAGEWPQARARFLEVLALPDGERRRFSSFAAFMLGRTARDRADAQHWYAETRAIVRAGCDDPLGLAVASYGYEARVLVRAGDDKGAIRLYAIQAAHGSESGAVSLLFLARSLAADDTRLRRALGERLAQRLLVTYAWTRGQENWYDAVDRQPPTNRLLDRLAAVPNLDGADRLAAAAWRMGRFELAARFAGKEDTPLGLWVQAKLALRRGDRRTAERLLERAAAELARAAAAVPKSQARPRYLQYSDDPWFDLEGLRRRASGDLAVLGLARADFPAAARQTLASCSYPDMAYLAERVLSADELTQFLAAHKAELGNACVPGPNDWYVGDPKSWESRLRALLARRRLRSGEARAAMALFDGTAYADVARQYLAALARAHASQSAVDESEALFTAAQLARRHGLEILGTEVAPDWALELGQFDLSVLVKERSDRPEFGTPRIPNLTEPLTDEEQDSSKPWPEPLPFWRGFRASLVSAAEAARVAASAPPHPERFHYRGTAADLALAASDLLPRRSQAWAALLCHAAKYIASTEVKRSQALWYRYTRFGAAMAVDTFAFGKTCPEPQFARAAIAADVSKPTPPFWRHWRRRTRLGVLAGAALMSALVVAVAVHRRRRRARHEV